MLPLQHVLNPQCKTSNIFFNLWDRNRRSSPSMCIFISRNFAWYNWSLAVFTNRGLRGKLTQCNVLCLFFFCPCRPVTEKVQSAAKSMFSEIQSLLRKVHNARIRSCNFKKATAPLMPSWSWDVIKLTYWFLWIYKCLFHKLHLQSLGIFRALSFFSPNGSIMCPRNPVTCEIHAYFSHLLQFPGGQTCIMYA